MLSPSKSVHRLPHKYLKNQLRVISTPTRFRHCHAVFMRVTEVVLAFGVQKTRHKKACVCNHGLANHHVKREPNGTFTNPCGYPGCRCHDYRPIKKEKHSD